VSGVRLLCLVLSGLALLAAGCGEDEPADQGASAPAEPAPAPQPPAQPQIPAQLEQKPRVKKPSGRAPSRLKTEDLIEGEGRTAAAGDQLTVNYVGVLFKNGKEFDASWKRNEPFTFQLGAGMVIPGWDQGLEGMKVGGRRRLTIPPELAYGAQGSPPTIGPNEPLVFVIDLLNAQ
jgi:peptidylprolyl isomerase